MSGKLKFNPDTLVVCEGQVHERAALLRGNWSGGRPVRDFDFGERSPWSAEAVAARAEAWRRTQQAKGVYITEADAVRRVMGVTK